jgi:hypothetical protein
MHMFLRTIRERQQESIEIDSERPGVTPGSRLLQLGC